MIRTKRKILICITFIFIHLTASAENHEYPDTIQLTEFQVYEGNGPKLLLELCNNLKVPEETLEEYVFGGTYTIKIYFNQEGQISDINVRSHSKQFDSQIVKDCISETLRNLPGWKVGPSPVLTREYIMKLHIDPARQ